MKTIVIILVVALASFVGYNLFIKQAKIQQNANMGGTTSIDNTVVTMKNFSFSPAVLKIQSGAEVTFKNDDNTPHTVTSESFDSGTINEGDVYRYTFDIKGTFDYHCSIDQTMKGQIVVE